MWQKNWKTQYYQVNVKIALPQTKHARPHPTIKNAERPNRSNCILKLANLTIPAITIKKPARLGYPMIALKVPVPQGAGSCLHHQELVHIIPRLEIQVGDAVIRCALSGAVLASVPFP